MHRHLTGNNVIKEEIENSPGSWRPPDSAGSNPVIAKSPGGPGRSS